MFRSPESNRSESDFYSLLRNTTLLLQVFLAGLALSGCDNKFEDALKKAEEYSNQINPGEALEKIFLETTEKCVQLLQECDGFVGSSDDCEWPDVEFNKTGDGNQMANINVAKKPDAYCAYGPCETCEAWVGLNAQGEPNNFTVNYDYYAGKYSFDGIHYKGWVNGLAEEEVQNRSGGADMEVDYTDGSIGFGSNSDITFRSECQPVADKDSAECPEVQLNPRCQYVTDSENLTNNSSSCTSSTQITDRYESFGTNIEQEGKVPVRWWSELVVDRAKRAARQIMSLHSSEQALEKNTDLTPEEKKSWKLLNIFSSEYWDDRIAKQREKDKKASGN